MLKIVTLISIRGYLKRVVGLLLILLLFCTVNKNYNLSWVFMLCLCASVILDNLISRFIVVKETALKALKRLELDCMNKIAFGQLQNQEYLDLLGDIQSKIKRLYQ